MNLKSIYKRKKCGGCKKATKHGQNLVGRGLQQTLRQQFLLEKRPKKACEAGKKRLPGAKTATYQKNCKNQKICKKVEKRYYRVVGLFRIMALICS